MLVFNGKRINVPGVTIVNFLETPSVKFSDPSDYGSRSTKWIRGIVLHTRMGISPQQLVPLTKAYSWDINGVKRASNDARSASWHISVDSDGSAACHLDLIKHKAYHASHMNDITVGLEIFQDANGGITQESLDSTVRIVDVLTRELRIQRQFPLETGLCKRFASASSGYTNSQKLAFMPGGLGGKDYCGVLGHRNVTANRGEGDPGPLIFAELAKAGYESYSVEAFEDKEMWKGRQQEYLGYDPHDCDGIPGRTTSRDLQDAGLASGMWVNRPGDYIFALNN